jgi:hypothetical protein
MTMMKGVTFFSNEILNKDIELISSNENDVITNHKLLLTACKYNLTLFCSVNGLTTDWIQNAFYFTINYSDFFII